MKIIVIVSSLVVIIHASSDDALWAEFRVSHFNLYSFFCHL